MRTPWTSIVCILLLGVCLAGPVHGQGIPQSLKPAVETPPPPPLPSDPLGRDTPRGTVLGFIHAANSENYEHAAEYLDTRARPQVAVELARQLGSIMNRALKTSDVERLSQQPEGRVDDNLALNLEHVGTAKGQDGSLVPILLERVERKGQGAIWLFSPRTLALVPMLHEELAVPWLQRLMPERWQGVQILGLPLWRLVLSLLAIPMILATAWMLHRVLVAGLRPLLRQLTGARSEPQSQTMVAPLRLLCGAVALALWTSATALPLLTRVFWRRIAVAAAVVGGTWLLFRVVDVVAEVTQARLRFFGQTGRLAATQLARRLIKATGVLVAVLLLLYLAGLDLTAALAGVGIGGIALAFAAQKTLENLFGGIMIISDQPVRVGDMCRVGTVMGTVEDIGLRSTRVRTLDRSVVSIPNGLMASANVENLGVRDKIWFQPTLSLRYETSAEQLRYVLAEVRRMLYEHPMVENHTYRVRFFRFGVSSLDVEIFAYVLTSGYETFLEVQEDLLLRIMDIVQASGTQIAIPAATTRLSRDRGLPEPRPSGSKSA